MASSQFEAPSSNTTSTVTTTNCSQGETASTHPLPPFTATTLLSSSPKNGQITEEQKTKIEEKLLSGQYGTLKEMATDIIYFYLFILSLMLTITEKILFTIKIAVKC